MAYTVTLNNVTGPDVVSLTDGTTYATLTVNANAVYPVVADTTPQLGGDLDLNSNDITGTGNINITGTLETSGNVTIGGNLTVNGTTTTINSTTLTVDDLNVVVASGAADAAAANGAGLTVDGANATLTYVSAGDNWALNKPLDVTGNISLTGTVDGRDVAADGTKLDGIEAGATADQTPAEIKTAYESNLDTNAYTDAEKSKLAGIEAGADVTDTANVTAAGALMDSEVTNLAAVKAFDPADYATAAQGALADTALQDGDTVASLTITTTDINGGTIDGTVIGGSTPAAISGTTGTFSGNLTVDTNTLFVDAANNRVGVGTSSPQNAITVRGATPYLSIFDTTPGFAVSPSFSGVRFYGFQEDSSGLVASIEAGNSLNNDFSGVLKFMTSPAGGGGLDERMRIASNGDISFYEDTGTTPKFFWDASAERLGINTLIPFNTLGIGVGSLAEGIAFSSASGNYNNIWYSRGGGKLTFATMLKGSATVTNGFESSQGGNFGKSAMELDYGSIQFYTNAASAVATGTAYTPSERMRIDASGNVGIGTSSIASGGVGTTNFNVHTPNTDTAYFKLSNTGTGNTASDGFDLMIDGAGASYVWNRENANMLFATNNTERMRIDASGNVGIGTSSPTNLLDVNADSIRVRTAQTPASASATGNQGEIAWDADYIYVCVATNTWKRAALTTW